MAPTSLNIRVVEKRMYRLAKARGVKVGGAVVPLSGDELLTHIKAGPIRVRLGWRRRLLDRVRHTPVIQTARDAGIGP